MAEPRSCESCGVPYKAWSPGKFLRVNSPEIPEHVMIPACHCLRDQSEAEYQKHLKAEQAARAMESFKRLQFSDSTLPVDGVPMPGGRWEDPVSEVLRGNKYILTGPTGCSKTTPVKAICLKLCLAGLRVRGGYMQSVLDSLKDMDMIGERMAHLLNGQVLVLDDLDKPTMTRFEVDRLLVLINHYDSPERSILVTLNVDLDDLEKKFTSYGGDEAAKQKAKAIISRLGNRAILIYQNGAEDMRALEGTIHA